MVDGPLTVPQQDGGGGGEPVGGGTSNHVWKWLDDRLVRRLEREAIRLSAGLEVVHRTGNEAAAVAKIESLLTKIQGLLDEADDQ